MVPRTFSSDRQVELHLPAAPPDDLPKVRMHTVRFARSASHVMGPSPPLFVGLCNTYSRRTALGCLRSIHFSRPTLLTSPRNVSSRPPRIQSSSTLRTRHASWIPKLNLRKPDQFNGPLDNQEEAARVAFLEKAMKGRQPTDLLLRCKLRAPSVICPPDRLPGRRYHLG